jgi:hypothetical protein
MGYPVRRGVPGLCAKGFGGDAGRAFQLFVAATMATDFVSVVGARIGWAWLLSG